jgi:capsular polysaccharide biosynthesis protein
MARVPGDLGSFEASQRVQVIENPDQPSAVGPSPVMMILAGAVGGLALGAGLATAAELSDDTVRRRADLERVPGLHLLARIPHLPADAYVPPGTKFAAPIERFPPRGGPA